MIRTHTGLQSIAEADIQTIFGVRFQFDASPGGCWLSTSGIVVGFAPQFRDGAARDAWIAAHVVDGVLAAEGDRPALPVDVKRCVGANVELWPEERQS